MRQPGVSARRPALVVVAVGFGAFVLFGMREGALGVAWPSIRSAFGQPLDALGVLLVASLAGYLVASSGSGRLARQVAPGIQLVIASCAAAAGVLCFAVSASWALLVTGSALLGVANGIIDVNVNAHIALRHDVGTVNLVHAGWGIGTTLGPLLVTASLALSASWRSAYLVLLAFELAVLCGFVATRARWSAGSGGTSHADAAHGRSRDRGGVALAATLLLFFVYAGVELATGQWAFTFLAGGHAVPTALAGLAVAGYWGALTAGRLGASALGTRLRRTTLLDLCLATAAAGCVLVLAYPGAVLATCGLLVMGAGFGPIFPTLVSLTPRRVGAGRTSSVMGYQLSAAAAGGAALSSAVGVALQRFGPQRLGVILVVGVALLAAVRALTRGRERA